MKVIAHRGASKEALENSWSAFYKAIEAGAMRIEFDVRCLKDHSMVVMHDKKLDRTTLHKGLLNKLDAKSLKKISLKNGEPIPFLTEVLEKLLPKIELNIELKNFSKEQINSFLSILKPHKKNWHKIIVSSFDPAPLIHLKEREPTLDLAALWCGGLKWPLLAYSNPNLFMHKIKGKALHPSLSMLNTKVMKVAESYGWQVIPYASTHEEEKGREELWAFLKSLGVDGFCTNYPRQLKKWLDEEATYAHQKPQIKQ